MKQFDFYMNGFRTRYTAVPTEQTYRIYAGKEDTELYYEKSEMESMLSQQVIIKAFDEEKIDEAA